MEVGDGRVPREASSFMRPQTAKAAPRRQYWRRRHIDAKSLPGGPDKTSARRERTRCASTQHPQRRIRGAYLGQVCVSADGPIILRHPAGGCARRSPRTARLFCVAQLEVVPDAFPVTTTKTVASLEMPLYFQFRYWGFCGFITLQ
jgi:hypothetical protein